MSRELQSGNTPLDFVAIVEGDNRIGFDVEATHYWTRNNWSEDQGFFSEDEFIITEIRILGGDIKLEVEDVAFLVGHLTGDDVEKSLIESAIHYAKTGESQ